MRLPLLHPLLALLSTACAVAGCSLVAQVQFRRGMEGVQREYVKLFDRVEARLATESREAASSLRQALKQPAIIRGPLYTSEPEFRKLHAEALYSINQLEDSSTELDPETLLRLRGEVAQRCQACHQRFRAADGK
jgi:hypothetical protein